MKTLSGILMCACVALASGGVAAQDAKSPADLDRGVPTTMNTTLQQCKDHMATSKKDNQGTEQDKAAAAKMDSVCADMLRKDRKAQKGASGDPAKN